MAGAMGRSRAAVVIALTCTAILVPQAAVGGDHAAAAGHRATETCARGLVALTFDDGPQRGVTPALLDVLAARHVPATFFVVGSRVAALPKITRRTSRLGFTVGNHTYRHQDLTKLPEDAIARTLRRTRRAILDAGAQPSRLMRPPYGNLDGRVRGVVRDLGLVPVLWTVDPRDWAGGTGEQIAERVLAALEPGPDNVVLLHDGVRNSPSTLAAVPRIVHRARRTGYCLARLGPRGHPVPPTASNGNGPGRTLSGTTPTVARNSQLGSLP